MSGSRQAPNEPSAPRFPTAPLPAVKPAPSPPAPSAVATAVVVNPKAEDLRPPTPRISQLDPEATPLATPSTDSGSFRVPPLGTIAPTNKVCPTCNGRYPDDFMVCPRDATPLTWASQGDVDPFIGTTLAETYRVTRVIGEGGMGRVYEAQHVRLPHRKFALKMLHPEFARNPEIVSRFSREAEAASKIIHPNVIDVYDIGRTHDGRPYLVAELLEGEELGSILKRLGKLDVPAAVHIVRQVCKALAAAHEHEVVHRDMKPENLFVVGEVTSPRVKVIDFGISKLGDAKGENLTRTGMVMGTPAYMAPEQARGDRVDHRVDVYATGAILYRLLTGRTPFATEDASAALTAVLTEEPPRPRSIAPEIPEALEVIIERAMAKDPSERYAKMADLDAALAPFDLGAPAASTLLLPKDTTARPATAADTSAPTMLAGGASAPSSGTVARDTRDAQLARPVVVSVSLVAAVCLLAALSDVVASLVLLLTGDALSRVNAILIVVAVFLTALTPFVLYVRYVAKNVWRSTVRAIQHAKKLRVATFTALSVYGGLSLALRFAEGVLRQTPAEVAWAGWGVVLPFAAMVAGFGAVVLTKLGEGKLRRRRRRRRARTRDARAARRTALPARAASARHRRRRSSISGTSGHGPANAASGLLVRLCPLCGGVDLRLRLVEQLLRLRAVTAELRLLVVVRFLQRRLRRLHLLFGRLEVRMLRPIDGEGGAGDGDAGEDDGDSDLVLRGHAAFPPGVSGNGRDVASEHTRERARAFLRRGEETLPYAGFGRATGRFQKAGHIRAVGCAAFS